MMKFKNDASAKRGFKVEDEFFKLLRRLDPNCRQATFKEQLEHVDIISKKFGNIDVKAQKRKNRHDKNTDDNVIWVELVNVQGKRGWLLGDARLIAFEQENEFLVVERVELLNYVRNLCPKKFKPVKYASEALYKWYRRDGRKDLIMIIKGSDLRNLNFCVSIPKLYDK